MISYTYNQQFQPPAPLVHVSLRSSDGSRSVDQFPAQLDIAADRTVIPARLVEELQLVPLGEVPFIGFGGVIIHATTYQVQIGVRGMSTITVNAAAHPEEPLILLGRDVLNHHRILLDGPRLKVEIE